MRPTSICSETIKSALNGSNISNGNEWEIIANSSTPLAK